MHKAESKFLGKDFWISETEKLYSHPHLRLEKCARLINSLAIRGEIDLLDVGCGPATLELLLRDEIHYYGIDIAIHTPAPNLLELDIVKNPIKFGDMKFDIMVAAGLFEYMGDYQQKKMYEIHELLKKRGKFIASYTNFDHIHARDGYAPYNNIMSIGEFRRDLNLFYNIEKFFPIYHSWKGTVPYRKWNAWIQKYINVNIPIFSPRFAISFFFICSPK